MQDKNKLDLLDFLGKVKDNRIERTKKYPISEILFLVLSGLVSGMNTWDDIQFFGEQKIEWLRKYLPYASGIPSHDTLNRVFSLINKAEFEHYFTEWMKANIDLPEGALIHIDGKVSRGSATKNEKQTSKVNGGKQSVLLLNAWASDLSVTLSQLTVEADTNETATLPEILSNLTLDNTIVTIDSAGCYPNITNQIITSKANYVIALKLNQPNLYSAVENAFAKKEDTSEEKEAKKLLEEKANLVELNEKNKVWQERLYEILPASALNIDCSEWKGLEEVIKVTYYRKDRFKPLSKITLYYLTSLSTKVSTLKTLSNIVRKHWSVENNLHWTLDVVFGEDSSKNRDRNVVANLSVSRKIALNCINALKTDKKMPKERKRKWCFIDDNIRSQCLRFKENLTTV